MRTRVNIRSCTVLLLSNIITTNKKSAHVSLRGINVKDILWSSTDYYVQIRQAILQILLNIKSRGFTQYATIDPVLGTNDEVTDSMKFQRWYPVDVYSSGKVVSN